MHNKRCVRLAANDVVEHYMMTGQSIVATSPQVMERAVFELLTGAHTCRCDDPAIGTVIFTYTDGEVSAHTVHDHKGIADLVSYNSDRNGLADIAVILFPEEV